MSSSSVQDDRSQALELYATLCERSTEIVQALERFISDCSLEGVPREEWLSTLVLFIVDSIAAQRADLVHRWGSATSADYGQWTGECEAALENFTATNSAMLLDVSSMVQLFQKHRSLLLANDRQRLQDAITTLRNDLSIGIAQGRDFRSEFEAVRHLLQHLQTSHPEILNPPSMERTALCARLMLPVALVGHVALRREELLRAACKNLEAAMRWHDEVAADERCSLIHELVSLGAAMDRQAFVQQNAIRAISDERSAPNNTSFLVYGPDDNIVQVHDVLDAVGRFGSLRVLLSAFLEGQACVSESLAIVSRDLADTLEML